MANALVNGGSKVLKSREVALAGGSVQVPVGEVVIQSSSRPHGEAQPRIDVERAEDGSIRTIAVRCGCGRVTTLQCEYFEQGEEDESANP